jgi:hypothetical protein
MSDQSQFYNPQSDRMALSGSGFILPRLSTTQRLALTVGVNDTGLEVYDTTAGSLYLWNGTTWSAVGGGGSRRILAATLTYTGAVGATPNVLGAVPVGTLPNPSTVLPGGVLQTVQYECEGVVTFSITLRYASIGVANDYRIPINFNWASGSFASLFTESVSYIGGLISSGSTTQTDSGAYASFTTTSFPASAFSAWPSSPAAFSCRLGEPNYGLQTNIAGDGSVARNITYNSLSWSGTVKVYYLFD